MADNFVAEIRVFPFNFAPQGWAFCQGQILPISQNTALFSLLGTNYGGNGTSTFGLPNLGGATAVHSTQYSGSTASGTFAIGQTGGEASVTLTTSQLPAHAHTVSADAAFRDATAGDPTGTIPGEPAPFLTYSSPTPATVVPMSAAMIAPAGSNTPHNNMMPYLAMYYCIALTGIFPPRS